MVVRTRSSYNTPATPAATAATPRLSRNIRFTTPSYTESSIRNYKIYTPSSGRNRRSHFDDDDTYEASEALVSLAMDYESETDHESESDHGSGTEPELTPTTLFNRNCCLNPMRPVTRYIYKLSVYNMTQTTHYNTSYIMYNRKGREYYVYSIISTMFSGSDGGGVGGDYVDLGVAAAELPTPSHTIQTRYVSYGNIENYIMKVVIPSEQRDYCVLADFIGVISPDDEFQNLVFSDDSCYYDVDNIWNTTESDETLTGHKMFIITPTHVYYWDGGVAGLPKSSLYTIEDISDALGIISSVQ